MFISVACDVYMLCKCDDQVGFSHQSRVRFVIKHLVQSYATHWLNLLSLLWQCHRPEEVKWVKNDHFYHINVQQWNTDNKLFKILSVKNVAVLQTPFSIEMSFAVHSWSGCWRAGLLWRLEQEMLAPLLLCHLMLGLQHNLLAAQGELKRIVLCTESLMPLFTVLIMYLLYLLYLLLFEFYILFLSPKRGNGPA